MKTFTKTSVLSVATMTLALGISAQAYAEQVDETFVQGNHQGSQSITIQYTASELANEEGLDNLYGQIKRAARKVCGPTGLREAGGLSTAARNRECFEEAVSAAVSQVGSEQLASIGN